jgi:DNA-binding beta-propeller fold protein YncE
VSPRKAVLAVGAVAVAVAALVAVLVWALDSPVVATIDTGTSSDVEFSPNGHRAYVAEHYGHRVGVSAATGSAPALSTVDTDVRTVTSSVGTSAAGTNAGAVALTPDGRRAYVVTVDQHSGGVDGSGSVAVVDTGRAAVVDVIRFDTGRPNDVAVSPDGRRVYVATGIAGAGALAVVDTADDTVLDTIPVRSSSFPAGATGVALSPDGARAYVLTAAAVVVVDTERRIMTGTIPTGPDPAALVTAPGGHRRYVSGRDGVAVVDTDRNVVVDTVPLPAGHTSAGGIAVSRDGRRVCVAWWDSVFVFDTATGTAASLRLGISYGAIPAGVAVTPDGRQAYIAGYRTTVVDLDELPYR